MSGYGDRFWSKVNKTETCWLWTAALRNGYGHFMVPRDGKWRTAYAHRIAYTELVGEIPAGMQLDHLCRVRECCNPSHLEPVTRRENLRRGEGVSGINARKTHCMYGHEFTEKNTYINKLGHRTCRTCQMLFQRKLREIRGFKRPSRALAR